MRSSTLFLDQQCFILLCSLRLCPLLSSPLHRSPADGCGSDRDQEGGLYCDGRRQDSTCCPTSQSYVLKHLPGSTYSFCHKFGSVSPTYQGQKKTKFWVFIFRQPNRAVMAINCKICGFSETEALGFNLKAATYFVGFAGLFIYRFFMLRNLWDCLFIVGCCEQQGLKLSQASPFLCLCLAAL